MKKYGLIGYPLGHSFSKGYFTDKFKKEHISNCLYSNYPLKKIEILGNLIQEEQELYGLNVTIPYKQQVIPFLDQLDPVAEKIGAVNCIKINRNATEEVILKGFNTDSYGFEIPLLEVLLPHHDKALILGTGGASKAVAYILEKHHIMFRYVSRKPKSAAIFSYADITEKMIDEFTIIVNTSPSGMYPDVDTCPELPYQAITDRHILYDLVYNPEKTLFLQKGEKRKAKLINGLPMLYLQAEKSWDIWNAE